MSMNLMHGSAIIENTGQKKTSHFGFNTTHDNSCCKSYKSRETYIVANFLGEDSKLWSALNISLKLSSFKKFSSFIKDFF